MFHECSITVEHYCFVMFCLLFGFSISTLHASQKIGTNLLSSLFLGDMNVSYELDLEDEFSWINSVHYIPESQLGININFRASTGVRIFTKTDFLKDIPVLNLFNQPISDHAMMGNFLEIKAGLNNNTETSSFETSFELWGGQSNQFSKNIGYEYKLGFIRFLESNTIQPGLSIGLSWLL